MAKMIIYRMNEKTYVVLPAYEERFKELYCKGLISGIDFIRSEKTSDFLVITSRTSVL